MASVSYNKEYKVNMGNYEHLMFSLRVSIDNVDDFPDAALDELIEQAKGLVKAGLGEDVRSAGAMTAVDESFILQTP